MRRSKERRGRSPEVVSSAAPTSASRTPGQASVSCARRIRWEPSSRRNSLRWAKNSRASSHSRSREATESANTGIPASRRRAATSLRVSEAQPKTLTRAPASESMRARAAVFGSRTRESPTLRPATRGARARAAASVTGMWARAHSMRSSSPGPVMVRPSGATTARKTPPGARTVIAPGLGAASSSSEKTTGGEAGVPSAPDSGPTWAPKARSRAASVGSSVAKERPAMSMFVARA